MFSNTITEENICSLMKDTRTKILDESLSLFSEKGFDGTTVRDIASAVGITASSLYKHFESKDAIFEAIFNEMTSRYDRESGKDEIHVTSDRDGDFSHFSSLSPQDLAESVVRLLSYSIDDPYVSRVRKLLTMEQFRNTRLAGLYNERYVKRMWDYHITLFKNYESLGHRFGSDIEAVALQYTAPIFTLLGIADRSPERRSWCLEMIRRHVISFFETHKGGEV